MGGEPTHETFVGTVAGIAGPVWCGWVQARVLNMFANPPPVPSESFTPFDLLKGRRRVARVTALDGAVTERIVGAQEVTPGGDEVLTGPFHEFFEANFGPASPKQPADRWPADWPVPKWSYYGAVFGDGDSIAVIGQITEYVQIDGKPVPLVTASAIGVPPKALRHAREIALALGLTPQRRAGSV